MLQVACPNCEQVFRTESGLAWHLEHAHSGRATGHKPAQELAGPRRHQPEKKRSGGLAAPVNQQDLEQLRAQIVAHASVTAHRGLMLARLAYHQSLLAHELLVRNPDSAECDKLLHQLREAIEQETQRLEAFESSPGGSETTIAESYLARSN